MPVVLMEKKINGKSKLVENPNLAEGTRLSKKIGSAKFKNLGPIGPKRVEFGLDFAGIGKPTNPKNWRLTVYADSGQEDNDWHEHYELTVKDAQELRNYLSRFLKANRALNKINTKPGKKKSK